MDHAADFPRDSSIGLSSVEQSSVSDPTRTDRCRGRHSLTCA
jgi:hypothetical protein